MRILFFFLIVAALNGAALSFPPDPDGVNVIDRFLYRGSTPGEEHVIYITVYNTADSVGTIELSNGLRLQDGWHWETVCVWNPMTYDDNTQYIKPGSVLSVRRYNSSLYITWIDSLLLEYTEGMASLCLDYDLQSREFEEFYLD